MKKLFLLSIISLFAFMGCSNKEEETSTPVENTNSAVVEETKEPIEEEIIEEIDPYEGLKQSKLTGLWVDENIVNNRPVAVVINNLHLALPQSGLGQADVYYEVLAEGEITRLVAIFEDITGIEKIGPIRSARDYFTYFALDYDGIFVHHGGSPSGYASISNRGIDNIDGMVSNAFWRDEVRASQPNMYEHSSYSDGESLLAEIENKGFSTEKTTTPGYTFYSEETNIDGEACNVAILPYSYYQESKFEYNENVGEYVRSQSGMPHIDELTGETLSVENVIIQNAPTYVIAGDEAGRREVELVGSGTGVYITNGNYEEITWSKSTYNTPTIWFDKNGDVLKINPGKTWICVFPDNLEYVLEAGNEQTQ